MPIALDEQTDPMETVKTNKKESLLLPLLLQNTTNLSADQAWTMMIMVFELEQL